tara:strand:+ start:902 stop:1057 length:156 start_codon:yes stop_codon:yes gene_type:complete
MTSAKLEKKKLITALKNDKCSLEKVNDYLKGDRDEFLTAKSSKAEIKPTAV